MCMSRFCSAKPAARPPKWVVSCDMVHGTLEAHSRIGEVVTRPTQEVGYLITGKLDLIIDGHRFTLHPGDSFRIRAEPFEWINPYDQPAVAIWVIAPPVY